jgi:hypothetical protein
MADFCPSRHVVILQLVPRICQSQHIDDSLVTVVHPRDEPEDDGSPNGEVRHV